MRNAATLTQEFKNVYQFDYGIQAICTCCRKMPKVKNPKIQKTTLNDFFPQKEKEKLPIKSEPEDEESFYNLCAAEELNLLQTEKCVGGHEVDNLETNCFEKDECAFIGKETENQQSAPPLQPSPICKNAKCIKMV